MAQKVLGDVLKRGEEIFQNVSMKLLEKEAVAKAFEAAMVGKAKMDEGLALALKRMNLQTRSEFRRLRARVDELETQVTALQEALVALKSAKTRAATPRPRTRKATRKA